MPSTRPLLARFATRGLRAGAPFVAAGLLFATTLATARCGLFVSPGDYTSGDDALDGASDASASSDALVQPESVVLPDGNVVPASIGTLALMAGERQPTSADDDPAWSADAWSGVLGEDGRVVTWRIEKSAPIVGSFESGGLVGDTWVMINNGFGLGGDRGTAIQATGWAPGIVGDWRAARANGAPGGLDEYTRVFFGAHLLYVGGSRTNPGVDGGAPTTFLTKELHVADVDVAKNALSGTTDPGARLVFPRSRSAVIATATNLYVVGGRAAGGFTSTVEVAAADGAAGTVEAFAETSALMNAGAEHKILLPGVAAGEGFLFVAGGRINGGPAPTDVVISAKIMPDGTLGPFQNVNNLPKALRDFAFVAFKGRLYVAGGRGATERSDEVYSATIGPEGTLGAWDASNAKLPGARSDFVALAY